MRSVGFLIWLLVVAAMLLPLLRRRAAAPTVPRPRGRDELVKDPVCQTYIVRSRAVVRGSDRAPVYFCSADCARRYVGTAGG